MLFLSHSHQVWKSLAQVWCSTWQYQNPRPGLHYFSAMSTSHSRGPFWSKMAAWSPDIMATCQTVEIRRGENPSSFQETSKKFHTLLLLPLCQPQLSHMATHNFTEDWQIESLFQKVRYPAKYQLQKRHITDIGQQEICPLCLLTSQFYSGFLSGPTHLEESGTPLSHLLFPIMSLRMNFQICKETVSAY